VTAFLENPKNVREFDCCQGTVRGKPCQGKMFIVNFIFGATPVV